MLDRANPMKSRSAAMSGPLTDQQAMAAIVLWNSGLFDTAEIGALMQVKEDAVCRTLHAARDIERQKP